MRLDGVATGIWIMQPSVSVLKRPQIWGRFFLELLIPAQELLDSVSWTNLAARSEYQADQSLISPCSSIGRAADLYPVSAR